MNYKITNLRKSVHRSLFTAHCYNGFTLLEIMIALAIVGVVVVAVLNTINYHADVTYEDSLTTRMLLIARQKITEMEINPQNAKGTIPGTDFNYENLVKKTEDDGIVELKTIISGHGKEVSLSELIIKKQTQNQ